MENQKDFIGIGISPNPNVPDMPLGLGMALFQQPDAHKNFAQLSDAQKTNVIKYVQTNNSTGQQVKEKIANVVEKLAENSVDFVPLI